MRVYLLECEDVFEVKDKIIVNNYRECEIVLKDDLYNFLTGGNGRLYKGFHQLCERRKIELAKKYV